MKKKVLLLVLVLSVMLPLSVFAATYYDDYNTMNFTETLAAEGFTLENKDYKETDDQTIIYLFRGQGCGYCRKFIEYLNSISKEYGKYFKVVSFEVWNDQKNSALMTKVANLKGDQANGVPYYIIGDETFCGYAEEYNDRIKQAIMDGYNNPDAHGDVFEDLEAKENGENPKASNDTFAIVFWNCIVVLAGTGIVTYFSFKNKKEILAAIENKNKSKK